MISVVTAPISSGLPARESRRRRFIRATPSGRSRAGRCRGTARSRPPPVGSPRPGSGAADRLQACQPLLGADRRERVVRAEREIAEHGRRARVVAVGVVVGGALAEVADEALEIGAVGTERAVIGTDSFSAMTPFGELVASACASAGRARIASVKSLSGPGRLNARPKLRTTASPGPAASATARRTGGAASGPAWTRSRALSARRAWTAARRTCGYPRAGPPAADAGPGEARLPRADRLEGRVEVADQVRELFGAGGDRGDRPGSFHEEARERPLFAVELREEVAGGGQRWAKYLTDTLKSWPAPAYCSAEPWRNSCSPLRVFGLNVLNSWSRSTTPCVAVVGSVAPAASAGSLSGPGVSAM